MKYLFCLLAGLSGLPVFAQTETDPYKAIVDSLDKAGQSARIIPYFRKELQRRPGDLLVLKWMGLYYLSENQLDSGEKYYRMVLKSDPKCVMCYVNMAKGNAINGNKEKAAQLFEQAVAADPKDPRSYIERGKFRENSGDDFKALFDYNKAIELDPGNAAYYIARGNYNLRQGYFFVGIGDLDKAVALAPQQASVYYERASAWYSKGRMPEALADMEKAVELDSTQFAYYLGRGAAYGSNNEHAKAVADYTKAISLNDSDFMVYYNRAMSRYRLEDMDGACEDNIKARALLQEFDPKNEMIRELDLQIHNFCDSGLASYYYQRGIAFYNLGQYENAVAVYTRGLQKFPDNSMTLSFRGNAYLAMNDFRKALADYDASLKYKSNLEKDVAANSFHTGLDTVQMELYLQSFLATTHISKAEARFGLNEYDAALKEINQGIVMAPPQGMPPPEIYYHLRGHIYLAQGRYEQALSDFSKSIAQNPMFAAGYANRAVVYVNLAAKNKSTTYGVGLVKNNTFSPNWTFSPKNKLDKADERIRKALEDCNKAIELEPELAYAWYIRGQIRKLQGEGDHCYDFLKARNLGYPVEDVWLKDCAR